LKSVHRSTPHENTAHRIRGALVGRRGGTSYSLDLTSWRQGREKGNVQVNRETFRTVQLGDSVLAGVHPDAFSLPWYSGVVPDEFDPRSERGHSPRGFGFGDGTGESGGLV
jgi:hypothetical protein